MRVLRCWLLNLNAPMINVSVLWELLDHRGKIDPDILPLYLTILCKLDHME